MDLLVENLGDVGLNRDRSPAVLPANAWTEILNGRCDDGGIIPGLTWRKWVSAQNSPTWLMFSQCADISWWIVASEDNVYIFDGTTWDRIDQALDIGLVGRWSGIFDGRIPYLNHPQSYPQYIDFTDPATCDIIGNMKDVVYDPNGTPGTDQTFRDLGYSVRVLRAHKGYVFAGGLRKGSGAVDQGSLVAWDNPTSEFGVSNNWVIDTDSLAGEYNCVDSGLSGDIVDLLPLRDDLIVYKQNSAWIARPVAGTTPVWSFKKLIGLPGMIAQDCAVDVKGTHYVWGPDDIYMHQGQNAVSIIDNRVRKSFLSKIDPTNYPNCYVVKDDARKEIWFCGVISGNVYPTRALIYNWVDETFTVSELPGCSFIGIGYRIEDALSYGQADFTYNEATFSYGDDAFSPLTKSIVGTHKSPDDLYQFQIGANRYDPETLVPVAFTSRFERIGVPLGAYTSRNMITEIVLTAEGTGLLDIYAGVQDQAQGGVDWEGPRRFNIATDRRVKIRSKRGQFNAWRIEMPSGSATWRINNMQVFYSEGGRR